jgi:integrase
MSHQSAVFYVSEARRFVWWMAHRRRVPVRADLFDGVAGFKPLLNRVHGRRAVAAEELVALLDSTLKGKEVRRLTGPDRYHLYLTAFSTGFRATELAALTPECFDLDRATVSLTGRRTKNGRAAAIPLNPGVVAQLSGYLAGRPRNRPVWGGGGRTRRR